MKFRWLLILLLTGILSLVVWVFCMRIIVEVPANIVWQNGGGYVGVTGVIITIGASFEPIYNIWAVKMLLIYDKAME